MESTNSLKGKNITKRRNSFNENNKINPPDKITKNNNSINLSARVSAHPSQSEKKEKEKEEKYG